MASFVIIPFKNTLDYANNIYVQLLDLGFVVELDDSFDESLNKRFMTASGKIIIVIGEEEMKNNTVCVRIDTSGEPQTVSLNNFIQTYLD
ncbi:hypothetical protein EBU95_18100 [bacterium]|nr:hypothetical protein [bacterium]